MICLLSFDTCRPANSGPSALLVQKAPKRAFFRNWAACVAHLLVVTLLVCVAESGHADTPSNRVCPAGDLSVAEYLKLSAGEREQKIQAYRQAYRPAMETVVQRLRQLFADKPVTIEFRLKTIASIQEKLTRKGYRCFSQMTDIAGVRAVIPDYAAIPFVSHAVQVHFAVREKQNLINDPRANGYRAIHYLVAATEHIADQVVELQIHTVRGTVWALLSHDLVYKGPYHSNEAVGSYFKALSRALYFLDSGFAPQRLPLSTNLPPMARREIQRGLMLIQAYDVEHVAAHMEETLGSIHESGLSHGQTDYYDMDEFDLSYERALGADPTQRKAGEAVRE